MLACVAPILTLLKLLQLKEWRVDRLREHLGREGIISQLFGTVRPILFVLMGGMLLLSPTREVVVVLGLVLFVSLGGVQAILGRQPMPRWTAKAIVTALLTLAIDMGIIMGILAAAFAPLLLLLPVLQPVTLGCAWVALMPLDRMLKAHVMRRAMDVRAKHPNLTVIGITGSVGKTTTKELLVHVLGPACIAFTPAYVNSDMGVAQWLTRTLRDIPEESSGVVVVEMGAYRSGEIALLCQIAKPTMGILTAIGDQHLALFGSLENLRAAKAELIEALPAEGQAFVNGDMQVCREVALRAKCPVTIVGTTEKTNLRATNVTETPEGLRMVIGAQRCDVPLHGLHNATNVLLAVAAAVQTGVPFKMVTDRLRSFRPPTHTFSVRMDGGITILDDTHNASTLSARAAIAWAKERPAKRRILIMNELIELGPTSQRAHVEIGTLASVVFDDVVILQKRAATWFSQGFGRPTHVSLTAVLPLAPDTLIVCIGRIPAYILRALHS